MKKRFLALALGTLAFGVTLGGVKMGLGHQDAMMVKAAGEQPSETVYKTLSFPATNQEPVGSYSNTWTAEVDGLQFTFTNFNNNNNDWNLIKCGPRQTTNAKAAIQSGLVDKKISKITFTFAQIKYANSIVLKTSETADFKTVIEEKALGLEALTQTVTLDNAQANLFYRVDFVVSNTTKTNGSVHLSKLEFFTEATAIAPVGSISLKADSATFKGEQYKGNTFDTTGLSVVANRTDGTFYTVELTDVEWFVGASATDENKVALLDTNQLISESIGENVYTLFAKFGTFYSTEDVQLMVQDKTFVESVEILFDPTTIEVGETTSPVYDVLPADATSKDLIWHVTNDKVATVDAEGNVKGIGAGTTEVYAVAKDKGTVESNHVEITVNGYEGKNYQQITVAQIDYSGTYLLGYHKKGEANALTWCGEDTGAQNNVQYNNGSVVGSKTADQNLIVLDRVYDDKKALKGYSIQIVGGANNGKYVTTSATKMSFGTTPYVYTVGMSESDAGCVEIKNSSNTLRYNASASMFRFYGSGQQPVQLYRLDYAADVAVNAKAFADRFVAAPICGTDDNTPAIATEFNKFVEDYSKLSRDARAYLANGDGKGDASFDAFYAKYNAIMDKRASNTEFYDFLAGKYRPAKTQGVFGINQNITDSTTWSLVGIGAVTIAASASLLFFRRKKSN